MHAINVFDLCEDGQRAGENCLPPNSSLDEFIIRGPNDTVYLNWRAMMGEPVDPHALAMTVVYVVIFLTGMVGNACTCVVISRHRTMHTATNYYLFSLAVSDLLLLILGLPQDINNLWARYPYPFGEAFCVARGWSSETSTIASILTITAFTVERYLAICHPLKAHTMSNLSRAVKFVVAIWIAAALSAIVMGYQLGVMYEKDLVGNDVLETAMCTVKRPLQHSFECFTLLFFLLPASVLCVLYGLIGLQLRRSSEMGRGNMRLQGRVLNSRGREVNRKGSTASRKDVIKMLVAVVVAFFVCWIPFHAQRIMAIWTDEPTDTLVAIHHHLTNVSGVCYYVSATINPILYSILSNKFRNAFRETLRQCLGRATAGLGRRGRPRGTSVFNSTLKSGIEMTEDITVVSEVPGHDNPQNGGHVSSTRKSSRLGVPRPQGQDGSPPLGEASGGMKETSA